MVSVQDEDSDGMTALLHAASSNHAVTVDLLAVRGADIHRKSRDGRGALLLAAAQGHAAAMAVMLAHGADVQVRREDLFLTHFHVHGRTNGHTCRGHGLIPARQRAGEEDGVGRKRRLMTQGPLWVAPCSILQQQWFVTLSRLTPVACRRGMRRA